MAFSPQFEAFRVSSRAIGIDLIRSVYTRNLGTYVAAPLTTFRAGMLVQLNASQQVEICGTGGVTLPFGFTKYTKATTLFASVIGEQIQLNGIAATNLAHAALRTPGAIGGIRVWNLTTGASYTEAVHYTANYVNGTVVRIVAGGSPADGEIVGCDYAYQVTEAELKFEGRNFWNLQNDVDIQDGKITVINDWSIIFTNQYDPSQTYAVNDALTAGTSGDVLTGLVTKGGAGPFVGRVFQVPTADDPFLGVNYVGHLSA